MPRHPLLARSVLSRAFPLRLQALPLACLLAGFVLQADTAHAQFCQGDLGAPISSAEIPLNNDQFGDFEYYAVVVFGNPNETWEDDETMTVTVYDGPSDRFRCLVLSNAQPPDIGLAFSRTYRFLLKSTEIGSVIDEIRVLVDLETGALTSTGDVWLELQELKVPLAGDPPDGLLPDCSPQVTVSCVEKKTTINLTLSSGTTLRPGCGNFAPMNVDGESIYSDRGEFTIQAADCIDTFGGAAAFDAPFLYRITGPMPIICQDGYDNDGDGNIDLMDPGCSDELDITEELDCENGLDDDGDMTIDFPEDPGCASESDASELNPAVQCDDGIDNDMNGATDFPADDKCDSLTDPTEAPEPALALLQAAALGLLAALRRKRA